MFDLFEAVQSFYRMPISNAVNEESAFSQMLVSVNEHLSSALYQYLNSVLCSGISTSQPGGYIQVKTRLQPAVTHPIIISHLRRS